MSVILPYTTDVPLKAFSYYSAYLGILKARNINVDILLLNHFITLNFCHIDGFISFLEERKLFDLFIRKKFSYTLTDINTFLKTQINNNAYVLIDINHRFISSLDSHNNFTHEFIVYGYDDEQKCFLSAGYVWNQQIKALVFRTVIIPYNEMDKAYKHSKTNSKRKHKNYVLILKPIKHRNTLNLRKLKFDMFIYIHNLLPSILVYSFNQKAYSKYLKQFKKKSLMQNFYFDLRFLKTFQNRAELLLKLTDTLKLNDAIKYDCEKMRECVFQAIIRGAICNATYQNKNEKYKLDTLNNIYDSIRIAQKLEFQIIKSIHKALKGIDKNGDAI